MTISPISAGKKKRERAVVLVMVLWLVVVLTLIAYSLIFEISVETQITSIRKRQLQAEALARAGVAKAMVDLRNDLIFDSAEEAPNFDAEGDVWARPEEGKEMVEIGEDRFFDVRVFDEERFININRIGPPNRRLLEEIIKEIGYNEDDAKVVASAIIDWADRDMVPALDNAPSQEEGYAYAILQGEFDGDTGLQEEDVEPLVMRNEPYLTLDELMEVYGVSPELYFGPGSPEAEYYRERIGPPAGDHFLIENNDRRREDEYVPGLRDYLTVYGEGKVNINTAPYHVLKVLAQSIGETDGDSVAESILRERRGGRHDNIDNDKAYKDLNEARASSEAGKLVGVVANMNIVGVNSSVFRIISYGQVGNVQSRLEYLVHRSLNTMQRDESFEAIERAEERRDRNSSLSERRSDSENELMVHYPYLRVLQTYKY